jgi:hypothetical protein
MPVDQRALHRNRPPSRPSSQAGGGRQAGRRYFYADPRSHLSPNSTLKAHQTMRHREYSMPQACSGSTFSDSGHVIVDAALPLRSKSDLGGNFAANAPTDSQHSRALEHGKCSLTDHTATISSKTRVSCGPILQHSSCSVGSNVGALEESGFRGRSFCRDSAGALATRHARPSRAKTSYTARTTQDCGFLPDAFGKLSANGGCWASDMLREAHERRSARRVHEARESDRCRKSDAVREKAPTLQVNGPGPRLNSAQRTHRRNSAHRLSDAVDSDDRDVLRGLTRKVDPSFISTLNRTDSDKAHTVLRACRVLLPVDRPRPRTEYMSSSFFSRRRAVYPTGTGSHKIALEVEKTSRRTIDATNAMVSTQISATMDACSGNENTRRRRRRKKKRRQDRSVESRMSYGAGLKGTGGVAERSGTLTRDQLKTGDEDGVASLSTTLNRSTSRSQVDGVAQSAQVDAGLGPRDGGPPHSMRSVFRKSEVLEKKTGVAFGHNIEEELARMAALRTALEQCSTSTDTSVSWNQQW